MYIRTDENDNIIQLITAGDKPINGYNIPHISYSVLSNIFSYKYINDKFILKENSNEYKLKKVRESKISAMSKICHNVIVKGFDHTDGHHYSLEESDQNNLNVLSIRASQGAITSWHYDYGPCQFYSSEEMIALTEYAFKFITYHQTYFNQLKAYINSLTNINDIIAIQYGIPLTGAYAENLELHTEGFLPPTKLIEDITNYDKVLYDIDISSISCK